MILRFDLSTLKGARSFIGAIGRVGGFNPTRIGGTAREYPPYSLWSLQNAFLAIWIHFGRLLMDLGRLLATF